MSWDDSDSEEDDITKTKAEATKPKATTNWDDSDSEDDANANVNATNETNPNSDPSTATTSPAKPKEAAWESSEEEEEVDNAQNEDAAAPNGTAKSEETEPVDPLADKEKLMKLAKKMEAKKIKNAKKRAKARQRKKNARNKGPPQDARHPSNQKQKKQQKSKDEDSSSSSDSSSDEETNKKPKKGMMSYEQRMATDNDILFKGQEAAMKKEVEKKVDDRPTLSGEVTLANFPLGSAKDIENLAQQVTAILDQKIFEEAINANDVYLFYNKLLSADILNTLDMVDTKALCTKTNGLLKRKQKDWHKKKNPSLVIYIFCDFPIWRRSLLSFVTGVSLHKIIVSLCVHSEGKKKKKPQWIVSDKFQGNDRKSIGHKDGQFDAGDFDLFD